MSISPVYQPRILKTLMQICAEMGVGRETVYSWIDLGAPIVVERTGRRVRYSAELSKLQDWRLARFSRRGENGRI